MSGEWYDICLHSRVRSVLLLAPVLFVTGCFAGEELDDSSAAATLEGGGHLVVEMPADVSPEFADATLTLAQCGEDATMMAMFDEPCSSARGAITPGQDTTRPPGIYELALQAKGPGRESPQLSLLMRVKLELGQTSRVKVATFTLRPPKDVNRTLGLNAGMSYEHVNAFWLKPKKSFPTQKAGPMAGYYYQPTPKTELKVPVLPGSFTAEWGAGDGRAIDVAGATLLDLNSIDGRKTASLTLDPPKADFPDACKLRRWVRPNDHREGDEAEAASWYVDDEIVAKNVIVGESGESSSGLKLEIGCEAASGIITPIASMELPLSDVGKPTERVSLKRLDVGDPVGSDGVAYKGTFEIFQMTGGFLGIGKTKTSIGLKGPTHRGVDLPPGEYIVDRTYQRSDGQTVTDTNTLTL